MKYLELEIDKFKISCLVIDDFQKNFKLKEKIMYKKEKSYYKGPSKNKKDEVPSYLKIKKGPIAWLKRLFRKKNPDDNIGKYKYKENKVNSYKNTNGDHSTGLLLLTVIPLAFIVILSILAIFGLTEPMAYGLQDAVNNMANNLKPFVISGLIINEWFPKVGEVFWLLVLPYGALVIICLLLSLVLDIVLLILYLVLLLVLFIISFIVSILFIYVLCPGIVILEIIMMCKVYKDDLSVTNKLWSTIASAIVFYVASAGM